MRQDDQQRRQPRQRQEGRRRRVLTAFGGDLPPFVAGLRSAGNNTPIVNCWASDGNYWWPKNPKVTNYYDDNYASSFGDDPNPAVNNLLGALLKAKQIPYTAASCSARRRSTRSRRH